MTQDQHFDKFLRDAYASGMVAEWISDYEYSFDPNFISLPVDAFGSDQNTVFRLAIFESLSLGNSKDVGLTKVCFEFHPSISVGYVVDVLTKWGCIFTSDLGDTSAQPICTGDCGKCSPAEVHECHLKRNAKN
jgi:hypothetical protein